MEKEVQNIKNAIYNNDWNGDSTLLKDMENFIYSDNLKNNTKVKNLDMPLINLIDDIKELISTLQRLNPIYLDIEYNCSGLDTKSACKLHDVYYLEFVRLFKMFEKLFISIGESNMFSKKEV